MNIVACIQHLFPTAGRADFSVRKLNGEQVIDRWNTIKLGAQPSDETLAAAWPEVQAAQLKKQQSQTISASIETIFRDEFSEVSKAVMAATFAGLIALVKSGEFTASKILINGASTVPPGVTQGRFDEVKQMLLALFP